MKQHITLRSLIALVTMAVAQPSAAGAQAPWTLDVQLYGLAAGMDGTVGAGPLTANLDVSFSDVLENLEFGAMGSVRIGRGRWAFTGEVVYMSLAASKNNASADLNQWVVEGRLSYRAHRLIEPFIGARYNNLTGDLIGPLGRTPTGTQDWIDPIVGSDLHFPLFANLDFDLHGDVGGFGIGSDLTWQLFPFVSWQFVQRASFQIGYRFLDTDYEGGSGASAFRYDVLTHGPQLGVTLRFRKPVVAAPRRSGPGCVASREWMEER